MWYYLLYPQLAKNLAFQAQRCPDFSPPSSHRNSFYVGARSVLNGTTPDGAPGELRSFVERDLSRDSTVIKRDNSTVDFTVTPSAFDVYVLHECTLHLHSWMANHTLQVLLVRMSVSSRTVTRQSRFQTSTGVLAKHWLRYIGMVST